MAKPSLSAGKPTSSRRTGSVGAGHVPILINDSQSSQQVADRIAQVMLANPASGVTPVRDQGYSLQVPPGGGYTLVNGEKLTINGTTIELRNDGTFGGNSLAVPIDAELALQLPAVGGAGITNGETFTINNSTFVFQKNGTAAPGIIPYTNADTPAQISARIQLAINTAGIGVNTAIGQTNVPGDTVFMFSLSGLVTGHLSANHSTSFHAATFGFTTSTDTQIAAALTTVVNAAGIGVQAVRIGSTVQLYGATSGSQDPNHSIILMHQEGGTRVQLVARPR